jgi:ethanolamine transporter
MVINDVIVYILVFFMIIGATDKIFGNKYGFGKQFDEGIMSMGPLAIAMIGMISLAPVLATILGPIVVPVYSFIGADPSMFATTLLALDMGGYPLAMQLAKTEEAGIFAGILLGTMLGPTIVFTIPVALGIIKNEDRSSFAKGVLAGIITIPLGCFTGGIVAGFPIKMILLNLVPIIITAILIVLGLWKTPQVMIKAFMVFGKGIVVLITIGAAAIITETLTGIVIIPGMTPIEEGIHIVGMIAIMLAGAFPMVHFLKKALSGILQRLAQPLGFNEATMLGFITSLAHSIPMFGILKEMDERGKVLNVAFAVSGAFVLGGHLAFTASVHHEMILPMIIGKITAGISAVIVAHLLLKKVS